MRALLLLPLCHALLPTGYEGWCPPDHCLRRVPSDGPTGWECYHASTGTQSAVWTGGKSQTTVPSGWQTRACVGCEDGTLYIPGGVYAGTEALAHAVERCLDGEWVGCLNEDRPCCRALTAKCLACAAGTSGEAFCQSNPTTVGCPATIPLACTLWSDGCNECSVEGGVLGPCTERACVNNSEPRCLDEDRAARP